MSARSFYSALGIALPERNAAEVLVRCFAPGHEDRHPSCSINTEHGAFNCKGCGEKGGAYHAAIMLGSTPAEAMALLKRHGLVDGCRSAREPRGDGAVSASGVTASPRQLSVSEADVTRWHEALVVDSRKLQWLRALRGWTHEATVELGLGWDGERVTIPARDAAGVLTGVGRYLPDSASRPGSVKMLAVAGSRRELVPAPEAIDEGDGFLWLVEGEADAALLTSVGLAAVGLPGVKCWRSEWAERFHGLRIVVCFDCDQPGRRTAQRVAADIAGVAEVVRILDLAPERDDGYDLTDFVLAGLGDDRSPEVLAGARGVLLNLVEAVPVVAVDVDRSKLPLVPENSSVTIETGALLDRVEAFCRRFIVAGDAEHAALALWVLHTHALEAAETTPYVHVTSPSRECGKTRLLEVAGLLVPRPILAANISDAALFRAVATEHVTVLMDEVDAVFGDKARDREDLRGLLNSGYRRGAFVYRMGGANRTTLERFETFGPKILSGIHELPDTLASRSIRIRLERRKRGETVEQFRAKPAREDAEPLREMIEAWAEENVATLELAGASVVIPDKLGDRLADCWEPLLAIADLAGGDWPARAREAAVMLAGYARDAAQEPLGVQLLTHLRTVFARKGDPERLPTTVILDELCADEEAPWATVERGERLSARRLARLLEPYHVRPRTIRLDDGTTPKGYAQETMIDAWERYCAPAESASNPPLSATTAASASLSRKQAVPYPPQDPSVADRDTTGNPHGDSVVAGVADDGPKTGTCGVAWLVEPGFPTLIRDAYQAGRLTRERWLELVALHGALVRATPGPRLEHELPGLIAAGVLVEPDSPKDDDELWF